jgi:hypothetical protein
MAAICNEPHDKLKQQREEGRSFDRNLFLAQSGRWGRVDIARPFGGIVNDADHARRALTCSKSGKFCQWLISMTVGWSLIAYFHFSGAAKSERVNRRNPLG